MEIKQGKKKRATSTSPEIREVKRRKVKQKECPYCRAVVGNLPNHIKMKHPNEAPPVNMTKEALLNKPAISANTIQTQGLYIHAGCKAELRYGETSCWHCGQSLDWTGIVS